MNKKFLLNLEFIILLWVLFLQLRHSVFILHLKIVHKLFKTAHINPESLVEHFKKQAKLVCAEINKTLERNLGNNNKTSDYCWNLKAKKTKEEFGISSPLLIIKKNFNSSDASKCFDPCQILQIFTFYRSFFHRQI